MRFTLDRATREITAVKIGADGGNYELGVLWSNVSPDAEVVPVASFYSTGSEKEIALDEMEWGDSGGAVAADDDDDDAAARRDAAAQRREFAPKFVAAKDAGGRLGLSVGAVVMLKDPLVGGEPRGGGASGATTTGTVVEIIKPEDADGAAAAEAAAAAAAELLVRVDVEKLGEVVVPVGDVLRVVDADAALGAKKKRGAPTRARASRTSPGACTSAACRRT